MRTSTLSALFAVLLLSSGAAAQVPDSARAKARELAQQGQDALDSKDFATAVDRFSQADGLIHAPTLLLGVARGQVGVGKWTSALEAYRRIVREGVAPGSPPVFAKAITDAQKELSALEQRLPKVLVEVHGGSTVTVLVDGAPVSSTGAPWPVNPGKHVIRAESAGFQPAEATITSIERKTETVTLELHPTAQASSSPAQPTAPESRAPSPMKIAGLASLGAGGAGLILGLVGTGLAVAKHGQLSKACPDAACMGMADAIADYHRKGNLATAGFIVGGALAATGVVLTVLSSRSNGNDHAMLWPEIGPGYAGVKGRF